MDLFIPLVVLLPPSPQTDVMLPIPAGCHTYGSKQLYLGRQGSRINNTEHFIATASDLLSSKEIEGHCDARLAAACSHPCSCLFVKSGGRDIILAKR